MAALLNATKNTDTYNAHDIMRTLYPEVSEQDLLIAQHSLIK